MVAKRIVFFGAGGFGREVLQVVRDINRSQPETWNPIGFIVDSEYNPPPTVQDLPVLGGVEWLRQNEDVYVVVCVGSPAQKRKIVKKIVSDFGNPFATLVHPRAWLGDNVRLGCGTVICAGSLITTDIQIGDHVHVNLGSTIGHDAELKDFVTLNPSVNISGNVTLQEGVEVGTGSVIIPHAHIGAWSIIGAGSTVVKPLSENITAVGSPARVIKIRPPGWHEG